MTRNIASINIYGCPDFIRKIRNNSMTYLFIGTVPRAICCIGRENRKRKEQRDEGEAEVRRKKRIRPIISYLFDVYVRRILSSGPEMDLISSFF